VAMRHWQDFAVATAPQRASRRPLTTDWRTRTPLGAGSSAEVRR
jgi:hypothetical protein